MKKYSLNDIASVQIGVYLKTSPNANTVYLQVNDFDNEQNIKSSLLPSVESTLKKSQHYLEKGDILFASRGNNNFAVVFQGYSKACVASSSFLTIKIKDKESVNPEYICWYLNLPSTIAKLRSGAVGTSILSIPKKNLEDMQISIPPINEQQLIVKISQLQKTKYKLELLLAKKREELTECRLKKIII